MYPDTSLIMFHRKVILGGGLKIGHINILGLVQKGGNWKTSCITSSCKLSEAKCLDFVFLNLSS